MTNASNVQSGDIPNSGIYLCNNGFPTWGHSKRMGKEGRIPKSMTCQVVKAVVHKFPGKIIVILTLVIVARSKFYLSFHQPASHYQLEYPSTGQCLAIRNHGLYELSTRNQGPDTMICWRSQKKPGYMDGNYLRLE